MTDLGPKMARKLTQNGRQNLENRPNRGKKSFFRGFDFRSIFEIEKNKKKADRGGRRDCAQVWDHWTGKERRKGGTKYLRYLDSKRIPSTRLEAKGLVGFFFLVSKSGTVAY